MQQEERKKTNDEAFESDTQKIIRRHLENEDDEITDEDIRNVRVGVTPPPDEISYYDEPEKDKGGDEERPDENRPLTSWDVVQDEE
jgi:hypothetical protein